MKIKSLCLALFSSPLFCGGCADLWYKMTPEAAHQSFLRALNSMVGQDIAKSQSAMVWPNRKIDETPIGNGLIRYRFRYARNCIMDFDVDARTNVIVSATFEGPTIDCSITP